MKCGLIIMGIGSRMGICIVEIWVNSLCFCSSQHRAPSYDFIRYGIPGIWLPFSLNIASSPPPPLPFLSFSPYFFEALVSVSPCLSIFAFSIDDNSA
jgi:hypothetical protein